MNVSEQVAEYYRLIRTHHHALSATSRIRYYLNNAAARLASRDVTLAHAIKDRIWAGEPHGCTPEDLEALGPYLEGMP